MQKQPDFQVHVTFDEVSSSGEPENYVEAERSVIVTEAKAQEMMIANADIEDYLNYEGAEGIELLANAERLTSLGFSGLARQIDADAEKHVAQANRHR